MVLYILFTPSKSIKIIVPKKKEKRNARYTVLSVFRVNLKKKDILTFLLQIKNLFSAAGQVNYTNSMYSLCSSHIADSGDGTSNLEWLVIGAEDFKAGEMTIQKNCLH